VGDPSLLLHVHGDSNLYELFLRHSSSMSTRHPDRRCCMSACVG
jgi:hypothetical protein